ncbi:amino acid permease [Aspergillus mulundensis]|uniref:Amino acid permease/ SLC12A domain-containing protein n=1 Tax=Aspergillus mulundensis TaxID=1810919 RepID=A0A3D8QZT3_9EURO|nr:hypothetical protein DSM5745_09143 [Aspergillus mulundensis]RDW67277.1 hypothetical protein DSM5745_09143 [Aspergillus mulundensis]
MALGKDQTSLTNNEVDEAAPSPDHDPLTAPLKRNLHSRHLQMIAIGGIIGPGLLVGSGKAFSEGGPAGVLISFSLVGVIVYFVMQALGEMATAIPVTGSFTEYAQRFVDDSLAFGLGWAGRIGPRKRIQRRLPGHHVLDRNGPAVGVDPDLLVSVPGAGERWGARVWRDGVWLSLIKVLALSVFFILAICISTGEIGGETIGFKYWHEPGALADSINGVARTFVVAGTLYAGTEMVGITAGESSDPQRAVPRAIGLLHRYPLLSSPIKVLANNNTCRNNVLHRHPNALHRTRPPKLQLLFLRRKLPAPNRAHLRRHPPSRTPDQRANRSERALRRSRVPVRCTRTVLFLARTGKAPRFLGRTNAAGVPWAAILFSNIFTCIVFLTLDESAGRVYDALITLSGVATFLGYTAFLSPFRASDFVVSYVLLPVFGLFVGGWKVWHRTSIVRVQEMDIWTGRRVRVPETGDEGKGWRGRVYRGVVG